MLPSHGTWENVNFPSAVDLIPYPGRLTTTWLFEKNNIAHPPKSKLQQVKTLKSSFINDIIPLFLNWTCKMLQVTKGTHTQNILWNTERNILLREDRSGHDAFSVRQKKQGKDDHQKDPYQHILMMFQRSCSMDLDLADEGNSDISVANGLWVYKTDQSEVEAVHYWTNATLDRHTSKEENGWKEGGRGIDWMSGMVKRTTTKETQCQLAW